MRYEWDEAKRRINLTRQGIDFAELAPVFENAPVTIVDDRYDYGESRYWTLGLLNGRLISISHTWTEGVIRIISARRATRNEEIKYFKGRWN
jgi:uncharacterized DUF497 family protein